MVSGRKYTGGKYKKFRKKKKHSLSNTSRKTELGETKRKIIRKRGGNKKITLLKANTVNVINPKTKKTKNVKIKNVVETPSERFLARQNILVKSGIIDTELGKVRITNRPSQEGDVKGELLQKE